jgi:hypothetical protein
MILNQTKHLCDHGNSLGLPCLMLLCVGLDVLSIYSFMNSSLDFNVTS